MQNRPYVVSSMLIYVLLSGCAADKRMDYRFVIVEKSTRIPIDGATVSVHGSGHYHNNRMYPGKEDSTIPPTLNDGRCTAKELIQNHWTYYLTFKKPGYRSVMIIGSASSSEAKSWDAFYGSADSDTEPKQHFGNIILRPDADNFVELSRESGEATTRP